MLEDHGRGSKRVPPGVHLAVRWIVPHLLEERLPYLLSDSVPVRVFDELLGASRVESHCSVRLRIRRLLAQGRATTPRLSVSEKFIRALGPGLTFGRATSRNGAWKLVT